VGDGGDNPQRVSWRWRRWIRRTVRWWW